MLSTRQLVDINDCVRVKSGNEERNVTEKNSWNLIKKRKREEEAVNGELCWAPEDDLKYANN